MVVSHYIDEGAKIQFNQLDQGYVRLTLNGLDMEGPTLELADALASIVLTIREYSDKGQA